MTNLKSLQAMGAFVPDQPIRKDISFILDGQEYHATIHVRALSVGERERIALTQVEGRSRTAQLISEVIRLGEHGEEVIPYQDAYKLHDAIAAAMLHASREVNGGAEKKSRPPKS